MATYNRSHLTDQEAILERVMRVVVEQVQDTGQIRTSVTTASIVAEPEILDIDSDVLKHGFCCGIPISGRDYSGYLLSIKERYCALQGVVVRHFRSVWVLTRWSL